MLSHFCPALLVGFCCELRLGPTRSVSAITIDSYSAATGGVAVPRTTAHNWRKSAEDIQWRRRKQRSKKTFGLSLRLRMCVTSAQCRDQSPRAGYWSIVRASVPRTRARTVSPVNQIFAHGLRSHLGGSSFAVIAAGQVCRTIVREPQPLSGDRATGHRRNTKAKPPPRSRSLFVGRTDNDDLRMDVRFGVKQT